MEEQPSKKASAKKREIQHNYHDHANDDGRIYMQTPLVSKGGVTVPFPMKLHNMLEHIAQNESELEHIVSWQPHGRCFLVRSIKDFQDDVLPRFFQQKKYASFQRQLNLYGFSRLTKGPDRGAYYHELFLRSKQILCRGIYRMKVKGTGSRMASNPDQEPNFYTMNPMPASIPPAPPSAETESTPVDMEPLNHLQGTSLLDNMNMNQSSRPQEVVSSSSNINNYHSATSAYSNAAMAPPLSAPSSSPPSMHDTNGNTNPLPNNQTNIVFDNMQFHALSEVSRRHSLMMGTSLRRLSMQFGKRGSIIGNRASVNMVGDNEFDKEMEMICQLGDKSITDAQMGDILDKIIDHRVI